MLASLIVSIALALGIAHSHATAPVHAGAVHVGSQDGSGGGPPTHP
jgi:hypothetical protein